MLKSIQKSIAVRAGMSRDNFNNLEPQAIKRLANNHEIKILAEKEGNDAKASRRRRTTSSPRRNGVMSSVLDSRSSQRLSQACQATVAYCHEQLTKNDELKDQARQDGMSEGDFELV